MFKKTKKKKEEEGEEQEEKERVNKDLLTEKLLMFLNKCALCS